MSHEAAGLEVNMPRMRALVLSAICLFLAGHLYAQNRANLEGTIQDQSGAVIPKATVTITNQETGAKRSTHSTDTGFYRVSELPPASYTVTVEAPLFKRSENRDIAVAAESTRGLNVQLQPGTVGETVTVTETAPALQTETGSVSGEISGAQVQRLPSFGRDPYALLRIAPGVFGDGARAGNGNAVNLPNSAGPGGSSTSIFQVENQVPISANGQRVSGNNYEIDGVNVNSLTWGGAAVITPNEESVKEIKVTSSTYSAEDGRNSGAQVKVVSQSGTNAFHGSAFFKYDQPGLNAYNRFTNVGGDAVATLTCNKGTSSQFTIVATRCPDRVNNKFRNFGGSIGGPIFKEKLFFFFSTEAIRANNSTTATQYVETPQYRQLVAQLRPNTPIATVFSSTGVEPRISGLLPADCTNFVNSKVPCQIVNGGMDIGSPVGAYGQYSTTTFGGALDGIPDFQIAQILLPSQTRGIQYNGRLDFNQGNNQFAVSSYVTTQDSIGSDANAQGRPMADLNFKPVSPSMFGSWVRTLSPTMLNDARVNFSRFAFNQVSDNSNVNFGIPRIEVEGLLLPNGRIRFGADRSESTPGVFAQNTYAFRDTFTKVLSQMSLKFGFEFRDEQNNNNLLGGSRPDYSFVGPFNLMNGTPIFEAINADPRTGQTADALRHFRSKNYAGFVQDDWKVNPDLTLNLGLRYEYFSPLRDTSNVLSNLILGPTSATALTGATLQVTNQLYQPDKTDFAPRLGFAFNPGRLYAHKVVFRGGFGMSYNRIPDVLFENTRGNPPFLARYSLCCASAANPFLKGQIAFVLGANRNVDSYPPNPVLAAGVDPNTGIPKGGSVEIWGAPQNVKTPYIYNYSFETEVEMPASSVLTLGYSGSNSRHLIRIVNENFIYDNTNPTFSRVFFPTPDITANYNALEVRLTRSFTHGLQLQGKYRWSRSMDELSNEGPGAQTNQTFPRNLKLEYGPSDFDTTNFVVISGLWDLPIFRTRKDALGILLGGWELNGIFTARSGFPWTPITTKQQLKFPGGQTLSPTRPIAYFGGAGNNSSSSIFLKKNGNFPGGGAKYFDDSAPGVPGIGRNSFRGPRYGSMDVSLAKNFGFPNGWLGERAGLELRAQAFNVFNKLNLASFGFNAPSTNINDAHFGQASAAFAGRVVELQARFQF